MNVNYIIYGSIIVGSLLLLSNFIDISYVMSKMLFSKSKVVVDREKEFLAIVGLWYQLKEKCDEFKLVTASDKLDEVFPLLNGVLENDDETV